MYCGKCGNKLEKDAKFCGSCGAKVEDTKKVEKKVEEKKEVKEEIKEVEIKNEEKVLEKPIEVKEETKKLEPEIKENNKQKNKVWLVIIALLIIGGGIFGGWYFIFRDTDTDTGETNKNEEKLEVWGDLYKVYLTDIKENDKWEEANLPQDINDGKVGFYDVGLDEPVMVISYEEEDDTYSNIYYIEDEKVNGIYAEEASDIEFLYDSENDEYDFYTHTENEEVDSYSKVRDVVENKSKNENTENFNKDGSGKQFDDKFIDPEVTLPTKDYDEDLTPDEILDLVKDSVKKYQEKAEMVNDKVKEDVENKKAEIEEEKKKKEEEASKFTSGIKTIEEALRREIFAYFYNGRMETTAAPFGDVLNGKNEAYAKDLTDKVISEALYNYVNDKTDYNFNEPLSEEKVKGYLRDLYGNNYVYNHKITQGGACAGLIWDSASNGYMAFGGCGGITMPWEPYYRTIIVKQTDTVVTLRSLYIVPTKGTNGEEAVAPYNIYKDESKKDKVATLNSDDKELDDLIKEKGVEYQVTFDKENGYYHFNNIKKIG